MACRPCWLVPPALPKAATGNQARIWTAPFCKGEKKADCANHHDLHPPFGLSGVDSWRDKRTGRSKPLPQVANRSSNCGSAHHRIAFDSDIVHKELQVRGAMAGVLELHLADHHEGRCPSSPSSHPIAWMAGKTAVG